MFSFITFIYTAVQVCFSALAFLNMLVSRCAINCVYFKTKIDKIETDSLLSFQSVDVS